MYLIENTSTRSFTSIDVLLIVHDISQKSTIIISTIRIIKPLLKSARTKKNIKYNIIFQASDDLMNIEAQSDTFKKLRVLYTD